MTDTPLTHTTTKGGTAADALCVEPSSRHSAPGRQGVGDGVGSAPGEMVPPAGTVEASAHTSAQESSSLLIRVTPVVETVVEGDGFAARTPDDTPTADPDLVLFRALADHKEFDKLTDLCRERLLTARDLPASLRWSKDRALVEVLKGEFGAAYDLLAGAHWMAEGVEGPLRGRYENGFGLVLVEFGRASLGLERFHVGLGHARDGKVRADIEHNAGRAHALTGEQAKAAAYFKSALRFARANNDYRLEMEVCESLVEFGGVL